jgi:hypothetical protein
MSEPTRPTPEDLERTRDVDWVVLLHALVRTAEVNAIAQVDTTQVDTLSDDLIRHIDRKIAEAREAGRREGVRESVAYIRSKTDKGWYAVPYTTSITQRIAEDLERRALPDEKEESRG